MLVHIALTAEILTTIICIYCIYGEKLKPDRKTLGAFFSIWITLAIINGNHLNAVYTFLVYMILFVYCKARFHSSIGETITGLVLCMVLVTAIQFMCALFVNTLRIDDEYIRYVVINMMSLTVFTVLLFTNGLHRLKKRICRYHKFMITVLAFTGIVVVVILLQMKRFSEVQAQYYLLSIPAILMLLFVIVKWDAAQSEAESMKEKLGKIEGSRKNYEHLLTKVRLRQHALKNHMEAISSFHYTCRTPEELVQIEEAYCNQLRKENKYNDLLLLGNDMLTGYLCGKFQTAEDDGIAIDYKITGGIGQCRVPVYYVIEMLGILFDNAIEAVKDAAGKEIFFSACEAGDKYEFVIRNPFPYAAYDNIAEWFSFEKSAKGSGRGLGLYHLKCLCREWDCDIGCRNMDINGKNWIAFSLIIGKMEGL